MVTLARPPTRSSLKITNRSFRYAAPCLWNELPTDLLEPRHTQSPALSPITHRSSSSSPSSLSPLASSLTRSVFHCELGCSANPFLHRPFPFLPDWFYGLSDHLMFLLSSTAGFVAWCVRLSRLLVGFLTHFKSMHFHFISFHVTKMVVTPFDPPWPQTLCYTQTSRLCLEYDRSYCRLKFYIAEIGKFAFLCEK